MHSVPGILGPGEESMGLGAWDQDEGPEASVGTEGDFPGQCSVKQESSWRTVEKSGQVGELVR